VQGERTGHAPVAYGLSLSTTLVVPLVTATAGLTLDDPGLLPGHDLSPV
jgi:hypothetical protein